MLPERRFRAALRPPPRLRLSEWLETHVRLPEGTSALPGPLRLWPYQHEIADAITDPTVERVTVVKPVRVGFTTLLTGAVASFVANDPAPILALLPTESDCRDYVVSEIEPLFAATPAVAGALAADVEEGARNTLLHRRFPGGSLKVVASKAPRNLRRHTVRVLLIDEADAMEVGAEGSPIILAERRTLSYPDRKIVLGSTPLYEETSHVLRAYAQSDQRVYELPCPRCGAFTEIMWPMIEWEPQKPETAAYRCPGCQALIPEREKPAMVAAGRWRATRPDVQGHAGFRLNALVSALANASWARLAAEFLRVKDDSDELQTFVNTILGQGWREAAVEVDERYLAARAEPFGLENLPADVLVVTVGVDVQDDRLEASVVGWSRTEAFILGHVVIWGSPDEDATWSELDELLRTKWKHPGGGMLGVDACVVDSGHRTDRVYNFCFPRLGRRIMAGKGVAGTRPVCEPSRGKVRGGRLFLVGVDTIKSTIYDRLARGRALRLSDTLQASYFEQLASERKVVRYTRGQPVRRFERKPGAQAEALDCLVYAWAARHVAAVALDARENALRQVIAEPSTPTEVRSPWVSAW
jgi:phage terminase large subunit GpA-like protein